MDLSAFTPDQLAQLKAALDGMTDVSGRSPMRRSRFTDQRQLDDLTIPPRADDPRPTFFWSAEKPRHAPDLTKTTPYPRLMWDAMGGEVAVFSASDEQTHTARGFQLYPPADAPPIDPMETLKAQLEALSTEDRAVLVASAKADRIEALKTQLLALSDEQADALMAETKRGKKVGA